MTCTAHRNLDQPPFSNIAPHGLVATALGRAGLGGQIVFSKKKKNGGWVPTLCWALSLKNRGRAGHAAQTTRKLHLCLRVSAGSKSWVCQYCSSTHRGGDVGGNTHRSQIHTGQRPTYVCCPSDDISWDITYEMLCPQRMGQKQMEKPTETFRVSWNCNKEIKQARNPTGGGGVLRR